jgi:dipeptidyl-peptidase-4
MKKYFFVLLVIVSHVAAGQINWTKDGNSFYVVESGEIIRYKLPNLTRDVVVTKMQLTPAGKPALKIRACYFSSDDSKVLIYTNTQKVWRLDTRGDYWVLDRTSGSLKQIGASLPPSSLMFAKFSPDGLKAAYVSNNNVFAEDLATGAIMQLTTDGTRKKINGTFDWAYEEEFACRDGVVWSPDSKQIAFWQVDADRIRDFYMINNTDSVYSQIIPVEYPTAGESPSPARISIINLNDKKTNWVALPGDPQQHYIPRIEWNNADELFIQQLNRKQNESKLYNYRVSTATANVIHTERDEAWIDVFTPWDNVYALDFRHKITWINGGKEFIWFSEKDGWRHIYRITKEGKETLVTKGDYDVINIRHIDEKGNKIYFTASPTNATQKYLFRTTLDGKGKVERVTPLELHGTHDYNVSPDGKYARHTFTNSFAPNSAEWIHLTKHQPVDPDNNISTQVRVNKPRREVEFFKVKTEDGIEMDGWMVKPQNFDPSKKYPVLFFVYTEPWSATVKDTYGVGANGNYVGDLATDGYIYMSIDNRGTPAPKGRAWRKSIYRKIGVLNIRDQAMAAKEILKWTFVDADRIAVWGWSGGGAATLNLMFQYPDIYKTGIAVAAVTNQLTYDNIYQERFMGLPQENMEDYVKGSPLTYAKNLKGKLLYIHGTGDDNVHYANGEMLINELVKYGKQFELMIYPNRTHGISEGEGTQEHLATLFTEFLRKNCPGGPRGY